MDLTSKGVELRPIWASSGIPPCWVRACELEEEEKERRRKKKEEKEEEEEEEDDEEEETTQQL